MRHRPYILFTSHHAKSAGTGEGVVETGNNQGEFTAPWLGIPATGKAAYLPYAALCRINDGAIAETVEFLDFHAAVSQAGPNPVQQNGAAAA